MEVERLKARRDQYGETLEDLSRDILSEPSLSVSVNAQSVRAAQERLKSHIHSLQERRVSVLTNAQKSVVDQGQQSRVSVLGKRRADLLSQIDSDEIRLREAMERMEGLRRYRTDLANELERITRASDAGEVLSDLRVTHCPACDQPIVQAQNGADDCFLCHRQLPQRQEDEQLGSVRLQFEHDRLTAEFKEAEELIAVLEKDVKE